MAPQRGPAPSDNGPRSPDASRSHVDPDFGHPAPRVILPVYNDPHIMRTRQRSSSPESAPICTPSQQPASRQPRRQSVESAMIFHRKVDDGPPRAVFRCPLIMRNIGSGTISAAQVSTSQAGNSSLAPALKLNLFQKLLFLPPTPPPPRSPSPPPQSKHVKETRFQPVRNSCLGSQSSSPSYLPSDPTFTLKRARFDEQEVDEDDRDNRRSGMRRRARSRSPTKPGCDRNTSWTDRPSVVIPDRLVSMERPIIRRFFQRHAEDLQQEHQNSNRRAFLARKQSSKQPPWSSLVPSPLGTQPVRYPQPQLAQNVRQREAAPTPLFPILLWNQQSGDRLRKAWDVVRTRREAHTISHNTSTTTTT